MFGAFIEFIKDLFVFAGWVDAKGAFPPKLKPEEEARLLDRLEEGDEDAKDELIERNLRLVAHIARKYRAHGRELDDLIQIGSLGLIKAVSTYTRGRGKSFASYAGRCVENEILMSIRAERKRRGEVSLEEPVGVDRDGNELTLADVLGTDGDTVFTEAEEKLRAQKLRRAVDGLGDERERGIMILRFGLDGGEPLPQREVGRLMGISRSYVSRIEKKAVSRLKETLENEM